MKLNNESIIPDILSRKHEFSSKTVNSLNGKEASGMLPREARTKVTSYLSDNHNETLSTIHDDETKKLRIKEIIQSYCVDEGIRIHHLTLNETVDMLYKDIIEYSFLTDLIFDNSDTPDVCYEEIRVNDYNDVRVVVNGREYPYEKVFDSSQQLYTIAQKMCQNVKAENVIRPDTPFVRLRLGNNTRVSIMSDPVARRPVQTAGQSGPVIQMVIRKQRSKPFEKDFLLKNGTLDDYGYKLLQLFLKGRVSMAFYGGTNSGKTATMASIAQNIADNTRTLTIAEIDEMNHRRVDEEGRGLNSSIMWEIKPHLKLKMDMEKCVNASLTFTPVTLIIQEIKGAETVAVIDMSITGHQVLVTLHADDIEVFPKRILGMYKQSGSDLSDNLILDYVVDAFPVAVRMKIYEDGKRRISDISEILSYDRHTGKFETNILYEFEVEDNITENAFDEYLQKEVEMVVTKGRHIPKKRPSKRLIKKLMENGVSQKEIESLFQSIEQ